MALLQNSKSAYRAAKASMSIFGSSLLNSKDPNIFTCCQLRATFLDEGNSIQIFRSNLLFVHFGPQRRIVVDDSIGNQTCAIIPDLLLGFCLDSEFSPIDKSHRLLM